MPMLECPGVFTMPFVPEGWTATSDREHTFFELQPPSRDAAVHVSVYRRTEPRPLADGDAETLLMKFVARRPTEGSPQVVAPPPVGDEHRAFARYVNRDDGGQLWEWFAACILWPSAMLICSCNGKPGNGVLRDAETMIASIFEGTAVPPGTGSHSGPVP
jgi:hypothetical protein